MRLDMHVSGFMGVKSRAQAQKFIEAGFVKVSGKVERKASRMMRPNDNVELTLPDAPQAKSEDGVDLDLLVLFEDDDCMVIDKPAGIAVHPGSGMGKDAVTILDGIRFLFAERKIPFYPSETLVHRLDKETTGSLLIAKNPTAHRTLQKQFESRSVEKFYLALVAGVPSPASAMIDAPIGRHTGDRTKMSVMQSSASRAAFTTYHTLESADGIALVSCELHTGRTHQIRVHMRSIGHALLGDEKYQTKESLALTATHSIDFLCLHAWKLSFKSPSGKKVSIKSDPHENFAKLCKKLKITLPK